MDIGFLVQLADGSGRNLAARYISMSASSTLLSRQRYRSMMAVSKDTPLSRVMWSVTLPEVVVRFSICATYCTLSYESGRIAWIYGETKLSGKINIQRSCFSSYYYCSSTAQLCGKLHDGFCTYRIFMRNIDK